MRCHVMWCGAVRLICDRSMPRCDVRPDGAIVSSFRTRVNGKLIGRPHVWSFIYDPPFNRCSPALRIRGGAPFVV